MRLISGITLVVHGLIHGLWFVPKPQTPDVPPWPSGLTDSWLLDGVQAPEGFVRGVAVTLALDIGLLVTTIAGRWPSTLVT